MGTQQVGEPRLQKRETTTTTKLVRPKKGAKEQTMPDPTVDTQTTTAPAPKANGKNDAEILRMKEELAQASVLYGQLLHNTKLPDKDQAEIGKALHAAQMKGAPIDERAIDYVKHSIPFLAPVARAVGYIGAAASIVSGCLGIYTGGAWAFRKVFPAKVAIPPTPPLV